MWQRDHGCAVQLIAGADARREPGHTEQLLDREAADGDDQLGTEDLELRFAPQGAQVLLARGRRAVPAAGGRAARIAPRHRRAVEGRVELLLVQLEPAPQCLACAPAPGPP